MINLRCRQPESATGNRESSRLATAARQDRAMHADVPARLWRFSIPHFPFAASHP